MTCGCAAECGCDVVAADATMAVTRIADTFYVSASLAAIAGAGLVENAGAIDVDDSLVMMLAGEQTATGVKNFDAGLTAALADLGGLRTGLVQTAVDYAVDVDAENVIVVDSSAAPVDITLPAAPEAGAQIVVKRDGANSVTITPDGTDTIDGANAAYTLSEDGDAVALYASGSDAWHSVAGSSGGSGATTFDSLTDVDVAGAIEGSLPYYDSSGAEWLDSPTARLGLSGGSFVLRQAADANPRMELLEASLGFGTGSAATDARITRTGAQALEVGPTATSLDVTGELIASAQLSVANYSSLAGLRTEAFGVSADHTVQPDTEHTIIVDSSGGPITVTLDGGADGSECIVKRVGASDVTIDTTSGLIDGASTYVITSDYEAVRLKQLSGDWYIV